MSSVATSHNSEGPADSLPGLPRPRMSRQAGSRTAGSRSQGSRDNLNGWAFAAPFLAFFLVIRLNHGLIFLSRVPICLLGRSQIGFRDRLLERKYVIRPIARNAKNYVIRNMIAEGNFVGR